MSLILVRHAKASKDEMFTQDEDRPLTKKGRKRQQLAAYTMKVEGIFFNEVWISPILRSKQTFDELDSVYESRIKPKIHNSLHYSANPQETMDEISSFFTSQPDYQLLLIGHNPHITELLSLLLHRSAPTFRTSEVAWLKLNPKGWELKGFYTRETLLGEEINNKND